MYDRFCSLRCCCIDLLYAALLSTPFDDFRAVIRASLSSSVHTLRVAKCLHAMPTLDTPSHDPYDLNKLAEELAERDAAHKGNASQPRSSGSIDLPELQPLAHDNEYLSAPEFDVEAFLLSRSNMSLSELRTELREYLATLKEELVQLINDDYEAFISLSTDLQGEGYRLERIQYPMEDLRSRIVVIVLNTY